MSLYNEVFCDWGHVAPLRIFYLINMLFNLYLRDLKNEEELKGDLSEMREY